MTWLWEFPPYRAKLSDKPREHGDDGDTVLMILDQGLSSHAEESIRLAGVWAPERRQNGGPEVAAFAALVFGEVVERATAHRERWPFMVKTDKVDGFEPSERRTFVRYVGTVYARDTGECLNQVIADFIAQHPEWGRGTGSAAQAWANG